MQSKQTINKQLFLGYLLLAISILASLLYCFAIDFTIENHYDAFNYFWAYKYLLKNIFDFDGLDKLRYFGHFPEFIYQYALSILTFFGRIKINTFIFLCSLITYALLVFSYLNIHKIYNKNFSVTSIGLQLQFISAIIPLGLTIQVGRQAFAFALFLFIAVLSRNLKIFSNVLPIIFLIGSHLSSFIIFFFHFFIKKRKLIFLFIFLLLFFTFFDFYLTQITWYPKFKFGVNDFSSIDKYYLVSLVILLFVGRVESIKNYKIWSLLFFSVIYLIFSINVTIFKRLYFGIGWFWIIILGFQILGEDKIFKSKKIINSASIFLTATKIFTIIQSSIN